MNIIENYPKWRPSFCGEIYDVSEENVSIFNVGSAWNSLWPNSVTSKISIIPNGNS